jgi:two-component system response regulator NreC
MNKIRVLLIDDHRVLRDGLCAFLQNQPDLEVVGQAQDGRQGLAMIQEAQPDVAVMDLRMPGMNGLEATRRIQHRCSHVHVLILSMHTTQEHVYQVLRAGASGFVSKEAAGQEVAAAIRTVYGGKIYLSPTIRKHEISEYIRRAQADEAPDSYETLTGREREVLQLIAEEHNTREIGALLNISPKTVETHRSHLMEKLDIHTTAGLTRYAIGRGIVGLNC